ncbi:MAG: hypothetical protein KDJ54_16300 [Candidatus Competibacteraceae bacterium]|nr:hypothetical protein [Candidatus Competibacteraceae bacterium]
MPHISFVGQAIGSSDCGYFAGYVISLLFNNPNPGTLQMTHEDVYLARNDFLASKWHKIINGPMWGTLGLYGDGMLQYLKHRGIHGYGIDKWNFPTQDGLQQLITENFPSRKNFGLLLAQGVGNSGHWVALLSQGRQNGNAAFYYYNSANKAPGCAGVMPAEYVAKNLKVRGGVPFVLRPRSDPYPGRW